ncbi:hypothetical protein [Desulfovibrio gilichinskyi]|uniref:Uncharacterized protein n=1 Tax=Desulfovibrio gilichinskyi TaxID=1519643 RepID=A0A1X7CZ75_9BACT|nr:hypothetical protein [Desulfovibrio gilichinskyi]SMF05819.1 hypothetical protein SAMN06295933_1460 [Desulfovibrio gilichinskyi]
MSHHLTINKIKSASVLLTILAVLLFSCVPIPAAEPVYFEHNSSADGNLLTSEKKSKIDDIKEYIVPHTSDSVPPSKELRAIMNNVKNQPIQTVSQYKNNTDRSVIISKFADELIKNRKNATAADEVEPSQALKAIFQAYRNGSLAYSRQTDDEDRTYYHPVYSDISFDSIYDLTILKTGQDLFLSLGNAHLHDSEINKDTERSQKIKELQQIIFAIKKRDEKKHGVMTAEQREMARLKISVKGKFSHNKLFAERLLGFLGIKRKEEGESYEELAHSYRVYRQWTERWTKYDQMIERKKARSYQLAPLRHFQLNDSINDYRYGDKNTIKTKQLKISPSSNNNGNGNFINRN